MRSFFSIRGCCRNSVYTHASSPFFRTVTTQASGTSGTTATAATATSTTAASVKAQGRGRRWLRRAAWGVGGGAALWVAVDYLSDRSLTRSCRALAAFARICYIYRTRDPSTPEEYYALHEEGANAIVNVCLRNDGLYVKLGQGLNSMSHVLPKQYTQALRVLLDDAATVPFETIKGIVEQQTGRPLAETFERFEEKPVASASIAQVHRAWLRVPKAKTSGAGAGAGGDAAETELVPVAVKVLKPAVRRQAKWDLAIYTFMSFMVQQLFDFPTSWSRRSVTDGLRREMDFRIEAANAERIRRDLITALQKKKSGGGGSDNPSGSANGVTGTQRISSEGGEEEGEASSRQLLYSRVYIPKVYHELTSEQMLVMEWVEATKLLDADAVSRRFPAPAVLRTLFDTIGDMVFRHGFVHCDPHAANVLVRPRPRPGAEPHNDNNSNAQADAGGYTKDYQVVLLDFGLCVRESERFRIQYALLFRSLFSHDWESVRRVVADWGISDPEVFASMQVQKPIEAVRGGNYGEVSREEVRAMQRRAHDRLKGFMINEARIPRELPLVGRSIDILRGINRMYGSPVDRLNMFVGSAVRALGPLHDYEGVDAYLTLLEETVAQRRREGERRKNSGASGTQSAASGSGEHSVAGADSRRTFGSIYSNDAAAFQEEQAQAAAVIAARRQGSWAYSLGSVYRGVLFQATVWQVALLHAYARWVNAALAALDRLMGAVVGKQEGRHLRVEGVEEKLERMQESIRVE